MANISAGSSGRTFGEARTDLLYEDVSGVNWVEPIFDEHLNILDTTRERFASSSVGNNGFKIA